MKKLKFFIPMFAVLLALGTSAFSINKEEAQSTLDQKWYDFVGDDPNDPLDYTVHSGADPICNSGSNRCAVKAMQDTDLGGDFPDLQDPSIQIRNKP